MRLIIKGNKSLDGEVRISGSKNASLLLISGALITKKRILLKNIPNILDVQNYLKILDCLNVYYSFKDNNLIIDSSKMKLCSLDIDLVKSFRASYYLIGVLLPIFHKINIAYPGGCSFEKRPIDVHLQMFEDFGAKISEEASLKFEFDFYKARHVKLKKLSFGATGNAILMGISAKDEVIIDNASNEVEINTLIEFLNMVGYNIKKEDRRIIIGKNRLLKDCEFMNIPDRMEIGTFSLIACSLGKLRIYPVIKEHLLYLNQLFNKLGVFYYYVDNALVVDKLKNYSSIMIQTGEYPYFPTDLQPVLTAFLTLIPRIHVIKENIYKNRFSHVNELRKLHANIYQEDNTLLINGIFYLRGNIVYAHDLRCGGALILAALNSEGETIIENAEIINRGYENIYLKLRNINADIGVEK